MILPPEPEKREKVKIKTIFQDHWKEFWKNNKKKYPKDMHDSIKEAVEKMLGCGEYENGYAEYKCIDCGKGETKVAFSCKGRFCASCGKLYVDRWVEKTVETIVEKEHRHLYFTIPDCLYKFFYWKRKNLKVMSDLAAETIQEVMHDYLGKKGIDVKPMPGVITVVHTFNRNMKYKPHVHALLCVGAVDKENEKWRKFSFLPYKWFHKKWRDKILDFLEKNYKQRWAKKLVEGCRVKYKKGFVVELRDPLEDARESAKYIGRYLGRPAIAERRIISYDGEYVTFSYEDLKSQETKYEKLHVEEFIGRLVMHIPKKHFQMVRRYGFYGRCISKVVKKVLKSIKGSVQKVFDFVIKEPKIDWRERIIRAFNRDPKKCPHCGKEMELWRIWSPDYGLIYDFIRDDTIESVELYDERVEEKQEKKPGFYQLCMPFVQ